MSAEYAALPKTLPAPVFFGDVEAACAYAALPGAIGHTVGPLRPWKGFEQQASNGAVVGAEQMDKTILVISDALI